MDLLKKNCFVTRPHSVVTHNIKATLTEKKESEEEKDREQDLLS